MHYYKLDDTADDRRFISGEIVCCRIALRQQDVAVLPLKTGDRLVVMLSNGAKYKALVVRCTLFNLPDRAFGELELQRVTG